MIENLKKPELDEIQLKNIFKDYRQKIYQNFSCINLSGDDINSMIILLNWCFLLRNNFFIAEFNKMRLEVIRSAYNTTKSNIFNGDVAKNDDIFHNIEVDKLKTLRYVLNQYVSIYDKLTADNYYNSLCEKVSKDSIKRCSAFLGLKINQ